jgi:foldase protein PrsA
MLRKSRSLALCAFFVVPALALSACGGDGVPGNAVARIGDQTIKKSTFTHWMRIAAISQAGQQPTSGGKPQVPDAPDFKQCIAQKKAAAPKPAKGQPEPTDAQLKGQCQTEYNGLRDQVMSFLILSTWADQEAPKQGIKVTDKEVQDQIDQAKKQAFPNPADFQKFLQRSGLTEADVFFQQRTQLLQQKITQKVTKGKDKVTDQQVRTYYDKNKQRFAQPERRDLRIVLTKSQARAEQAKKAIQSGQSFASVAKKFSIDQASKNQGGKLAGVSKGQQEQALDTAIFSAKKGELVGPVKTQFGWYILEVTGITPGKQQSLQQSEPSIKQILASENQRKALENFGKSYRKRWKDATTCREGYVTQDCSNAPKQKPATTTAQPPQSGQTQTQP